MKYWFDTEFIEDGKTIDLISIGIVSEDGREFYAEAEFNKSKASDWVRSNVFPNLYWNPWPKVQIKNSILDFCHDRAEFWAYYADYDWVVFCQLFGTMMALPENFPMYCRDIKQWCDMLGNPKLPKQGKGEHHALNDARWNKLAWEFLNRYKEEK